MQFENGGQANTRRCKTAMNAENINNKVAKTLLCGCLYEVIRLN